MKNLVNNQKLSCTEMWKLLFLTIPCFIQWKRGRKELTSSNFHKAHLFFPACYVAGRELREPRFNKNHSFLWIISITNKNWRSKYSVSQSLIKFIGLSYQMAEKFGTEHKCNEKRPQSQSGDKITLPINKQITAIMASLRRL